jgi:hypothetical protein
MTSSAASRNRISGRVPVALRSANIVGSCSKKPRVRTSSTTASRVEVDVPGLLADLGQHGRRQVVDHIPAEILQRVRRRRPAGHRHPGDDHEPQRLGGGRLVRGMEARWSRPIISARISC